MLSTIFLYYNYNTLEPEPKSITPIEFVKPLLFSFDHRKYFGGVAFYNCESVWPEMRLSCNPRRIWIIFYQLFLMSPTWDMVLFSLLTFYTVCGSKNLRRDDDGHL